MAAPRTLFDKVWARHVVAEPDGEPTLIYIDLHLVHEVTSPQAFDGLRMTGRKLRRPDRHLATVDQTCLQPAYKIDSSSQTRFLQPRSTPFGRTVLSSASSCSMCRIDPKGSCT